MRTRVLKPKMVVYTHVRPVVQPITIPGRVASDNAQHFKNEYLGRLREPCIWNKGSVMLTVDVLVALERTMQEVVRTAKPVITKRRQSPSGSTVKSSSVKWMLSTA